MSCRCGTEQARLRAPVSAMAGCWKKLWASLADLPEAAHATPLRSYTVAATPLRLKKYAMLQPITPAPQITTLGKCPRISCCRCVRVYLLYVHLGDLQGSIHDLS